jgi:hypothetical protein
MRSWGCSVHGRRCGLRPGRWTAALLLGCSAVASWAAGPRWVTGPPFFSTSGQPVVWYTDTPQYFTDPGDLSATVTHAAADAIVAAAAGVWNAPTSRLRLVQGGLLAQHVSGMNAYAGSAGIVFPADVQAANYQTRQIAVIYDRDGSVTDLLLGVGGSDPSGCRQSAVTESVDSIVPSGKIQHAVLVLNGRCTGSAPEMQLQMQYQLMRAFGRILGLGWSQTNDNVFTGSPVASYQQALHWPVMHPIDVICGVYTFQCMPLPFTLRADDLSSLALLYPIGQGQAGAGQTDTLLNSSRIGGVIRFPNGQSMQGVNVVGRRLSWFRPDSDTEKWQTVSSVSGFRFRRSNPNPIAATDPSLSGSMGGYSGNDEGWYELTRMPMLPGDWQKVLIETEPINPLYVGPYSVGPYTSSTVLPSGSSPEDFAGLFGGYGDYGWFDYVLGGGASTCAVPPGSETTPQGVAAEGWWTGQLCGYGQTVWMGMPIRANRSLTVEITAQDEQGFATITKAMPVVGVWRATDVSGSKPVLAASKAFNRVSAGLTSLAVQGLGAGTLRIGIADERGDGRPDFNFGARVLYADTVTPANVGAGGGVVTITGRGFRSGNVVTVNSVAAVVQSWTSTTIVATVPASKKLASGTPPALVADVTVRDASTKGTTVMTGALAYAAALPEVMRLVSAPAGPVTTAVLAADSFAVRVFEADGVTPVAGEPVVLSSPSVVRFAACGTASCTVVTDATGTASSGVTALAAGLIVLNAIGDSSQIAASFTAVDPPDQIALVSAPIGTVFVGDTAATGFAVRVTKGDGVTPVTGATVVFAAVGNGVRFGACGATTCTVTTDSAGVASTRVTPLAAGTFVLSATGGPGRVTAALTALVKVRTVTAIRAVEYIAEAARVAWSPQVVLADNSASVNGVAVVWTGIGPGTTLSDVTGSASTPTIVGPVAAGMQATGTACAWITVCAGFAAQGVAVADLRVEVLVGAGQSVAADATLAPVTVLVTDGLGHGVAGAVVRVYQMVQAGVVCAGQGRCPAQAVLDRDQSEFVSDVDGRASFPPLQRSGQAEVTNLVVTAGTQGFASVSLTKGW